MLKRIGETVPARDLGAERVLARRAESLIGMPIGVPKHLPPDEAARFLTETLPKHEGPVKGRVAQGRYRISDVPLAAQLEVANAGDGYQVDVKFSSDQGEASVEAVLRAWSSGRSLVPLVDGGWAQLPADWLARHGPILRELLEARSSDGTIRRHGTAALVELFEEAELEVPPDLQRCGSGSRAAKAFRKWPSRTTSRASCGLTRKRAFAGCGSCEKSTCTASSPMTWGSVRRCRPWSRSTTARAGTSLSPRRRCCGTGNEKPLGSSPA